MINVGIERRRTNTRDAQYCLGSDISVVLLILSLLPTHASPSALVQSVQREGGPDGRTEGRIQTPVDTLIHAGLKGPCKGWPEEKKHRRDFHVRTKRLKRTRVGAAVVVVVWWWWEGRWKWWW